MGRTLLACLVGAALLAPGVARAQNQWERTVRSQIRQHSQFLTDRDYGMSGDVYQGKLDNHETEYLSITLHPGTSYAFLAVCDEDCRDVDLRLFDPDGDEVDSDVGTDDWPIVKVTPSVTGKYQVKVIMASCAGNPCYYGIGVFTK
ncbi:MAG: hypothetical protein AUH42_01240 [Gemmatimonadetes bacterium 13_1_40CM_70_11]|nr:MAG: hypothetical protein AUH42_01240 [Gemmatimonadetes bacterium 13_1_40CM_70_11]